MVRTSDLVLYENGVDKDEAVYRNMYVLQFSKNNNF